MMEEHEHIKHITALTYQEQNLHAKNSKKGLYSIVNKF